MAGEFKAKGANVMLGPVAGPLGRVVRGGRNWEGFTVDPYLSGVLVSETVTAVQKVGVMASTKVSDTLLFIETASIDILKHFIGNEQEDNRQTNENKEAISSNIDDRTMHELYLWPFQDAVRAGTSNVMCSYQRVNNSYGCANSKTQNGLLKEELGFQVSHMSFYMLAIFRPLTIDLGFHCIRLGSPARRCCYCACWDGHGHANW